MLQQPPLRQPFFDANGQMSRVWWIWFNDLYKLTTQTHVDGTEDLAVLQAFSETGAGEHLDRIEQLETALASLPNGTNTTFRQLISDIQVQLNQPVRNVKIPDNLETAYFPPVTRALSAIEDLKKNDTPHSHPIGAIRGLQNALDGLNSQLENIKNIALPTSLPPSGSAGGDLSGTYPNPTIKSDVNLSGNPTTTTQAITDNSNRVATDAFVQAVVANAIAGVNPAVAVQAATTTAANTSGLTYNNGVSGIGATLTGVANTALTVDGYTFTAVGQRLLVKDDTQSPSGAFNGVYYVTQIQTAILPIILTRALDYDMPSDINNTGAIPVINGTVNGSTSWVLTSQVTTVGTDPLTYTQFTLNPSTLITTSTSAGGDLSGTYPNPTVAKINGATLGTTTASSGNLLIGSGSQWATQAMSGDVTINSTGVTAIGAGKVTSSMLVANQVIRSPGITIDGGGAVPTTGSKGFFTFPYAATITNWYLAADVSGSCVIDIKRSGTSIVGGGGNKPTLSSAQTGNAAVSGWTSTSISAGDILEYNLDSISTITRVTLTLKVNAT